jgi:hypothetical protein
MAKIEYSPLVSRIIGRLGDLVYASVRSTNYVRTVSTSTYDPITARQAQIRANFAHLSAAFLDLSEAQVTLFTDYASAKGMTGGAKGAFIHLMGNLLNASHGDLVELTGPPHTPATPKFPRHFCVTPIAHDVICLSWTIPDDTETYVTGHYRLHYSFCQRHPCYGNCPCQGYNRKWAFVKTERADQFAIQHVHDWPTNTRLFYRLNSIDKRGRKSPITHTIMTTTPPP